MTVINFRTTFATIAVASGVDIKTTQALMGHTTLKVYAKKEESRLLDATERMESFWRAEKPVFARNLDVE